MSQGTTLPRFCHRCGAGLATEALFCSSCGATVVGSATAPIVEPAAFAGSAEAHSSAADSTTPPRSVRGRTKIGVGAAILVVAGIVGAALVLKGHGSNGTGTTKSAAADAAAVLTASNHAWGSGNFALDCSKYEAAGPEYAYSDVANCELGEKESWTQLPAADRSKFAALTAVAQKALVLPENVVVFWDRDLVASQGLPSSDGSQQFTAIRLVPGEGWRWAGSGDASDPSSWVGYIPPGLADAAVAAGLPAASPSS